MRVESDGGGGRNSQRPQTSRGSATQPLWSTKPGYGRLLLAHWVGGRNRMYCALVEGTRERREWGGRGGTSASHQDDQCATRDSEVTARGRLRPRTTDHVPAATAHPPMAVGRGEFSTAGGGWASPLDGGPRQCLATKAPACWHAGLWCTPARRHTRTARACISHLENLGKLPIHGKPVALGAGHGGFAGRGGRTIHIRKPRLLQAAARVWLSRCRTVTHALHVGRVVGLLIQTAAAPGGRTRRVGGHVRRLPRHRVLFQRQLDCGLAGRSLLREHPTGVDGFGLCGQGVQYT